MPRKAKNLLAGLYTVRRRRDGWWWRCRACKAEGGPFNTDYFGQAAAHHKGGGHVIFVCGRETKASIDMPLLDMPLDKAMINRDSDTE